MRPISQRVKDLLEQEPDICALKALGGCQGRITREHTLIYAGKQIDEAWAIIKICARHHGVDQWQDAGTMDKERNVWIALNKATDSELTQYSKVINYIDYRNRLNKQYGTIN